MPDRQRLWICDSCPMTGTSAEAKRHCELTGHVVTQSHDRDVLSDRPESHDPLTCELCHAEGISTDLAELPVLRAENERLREALGNTQGEAYLACTVGGPNPLVALDTIMGVCRSALAADEQEATG